MSIARYILMVALMAALSFPAAAQSEAAQPSPSQPATAKDQTAQKQPIPTLDGDAGSCSLSVTVQDGKGTPVEGAQVRLFAKYGFLGMHDVDLTLQTGPAGQVRFTGLPDKTHGVAYINASEGNRKGVAVYDPQNACDNQHTIIVAPPLNPAAPPPASNTPPGA